MASIDWEASNILDKLSSAERFVLRHLREDGKGNYDPSLTRARKSLANKGLADQPMVLGFGRTMIACVQHPTELGVRVQHFLGVSA